MSLLNYSVTLVAGTNENINDVRSLFDEVRAVVNNLDNENIAPNAGIDWSKIDAPVGTIKYNQLDPLSTGQIIVGDGGVPTPRVLSGSSTIGPGGVLSQRFEHRPQGVDQNLPISNTFQALPSCVCVPLAGTWLFLGHCQITLGDAGGVIHTEMRLRTATTFALSEFGNLFNSRVTHNAIGVVNLNGSETVVLDARAAAATGANMVATGGVLVGVKLN